MAGGFRRDVLPPMRNAPPRTRGGRMAGKTIAATRRSGSANFKIADQTVDSTGAPLAGCTVDLFTWSDRVWLATTTSDGGGNYSFIIGPIGGTFFVRAYLAGAPDVFGETDQLFSVPV